MEMEEERTNKHRKRKIIPFSNLTIGGESGIAGLFMFGGALAFADFMAVASFATKRNKTKRIHHHQPKPKQFLFDDDRCKSSEDNHETTQSLSSLQHSTHQVEDVTCYRTSNPDSSSKLVSAQPLMEEKIDNKLSSEEESPTCFNHQEIAFSDYSNQESATSSNENQVALEEEKKDEPQGALTSTETEDDDDSDMKSDDVRETTETDDDDKDMFSDDARETDEEDSLKAIGTTSLDCNEEPILMTVPKEATLNKNAKFSLMSNHQPSILTTWVKPMLLLALLSLIVVLTLAYGSTFMSLIEFKINVFVQ